MPRKSSRFREKRQAAAAKAPVPTFNYFGSVQQLENDRRERVKLLAGADNLDWLQLWACQFVRDQLCPAFSANYDFEQKAYLVDRLGTEIRAAVVKRLRKKYPAGARRTEIALVRSYKVPTLEFLERAVCHVGERFLEDQAKHPSDHFVSRCARVLPQLWPLPNARGTSRLGKSIQLHRLIAYRWALEVTPDPTSSRRGYTAADLADLLPDMDLENVRHLKRDRIAQLFACRAMGALPAISAERFRHLLQRLEAGAKRIDSALR